MILWKILTVDLYISLLNHIVFLFLMDEYFSSFLKYFVPVSNRRTFYIIDILISNNWLLI